MAPIFATYLSTYESEGGRGEYYEDFHCDLRFNLTDKINQIIRQIKCLKRGIRVGPLIRLFFHHRCSKTIVNVANHEGLVTPASSRAYMQKKLKHGWNGVNFHKALARSPNIVDD